MTSLILPLFKIENQMNLDNDNGAFLFDENENIPIDSEHYPCDRATERDPEYSGTVQVSSETAEAPMQRKKKLPKGLEVDEPQELLNAQLAQWNTEYAKNMAIASKQKQQNKLLTLAKKNAAFWVLGCGIGSVGVGLGSYEVPHPLNAYSGERLWEMVSGTKKQTSGRKRNRNVGEDNDSGIENGRNVRSRKDEGGQTDHGEDLAMNDMEGIVYDVFYSNLPYKLYLLFPRYTQYKDTNM
jgi:hypothetical protein